MPEIPPALADLAKKVDLLEAEVDDLTRSVQALQDENAFLQRLLADPSSPLHPPAARPVLSPDRAPRPRPAVMVAAGHPAQPASSGSSATGSSPTTSAPRTRRTRSTRRSAFPTSCRTCSAKACSPRRSSRSTPGCAPRGRRREARRVAGGGGGAARAGRRRCWCWSGVLLDALADRRHRAGLRRERSASSPSGWCGSCFPGPGLLVLSAWCLGVLNSHGRFFLSLRGAGALEPRDHRRAGGVRRPRGAQLPAGRDRGVGIGRGQPAAVRCVQLPTVLAAARRAPAAARARARAPVARCCATSGRCSSAAAWCRSAPTWTRCSRACCPTGAVAGLSYAQVLYTLPVSLFGMSVSAAELPAMSSATGTRERACGLPAGPARGGAAADRVLRRALGVAFLALGDVVAGALYQSGAFTRAMTLYVWGILAGSAVGLLASTMGRLYASTYYALHDTRTPLRYRPGPGAPSRSCWATCSRCRCRARWESAGGGAPPGLTGVGRHRGLGGVPAAAARAVNRRIGATGLPAGAGRPPLGGRRARRGRGGWLLAWCCRAAASDCRGRAACSPRSAWCTSFVGLTVSACPRRAALLRRSSTLASGTLARRSAGPDSVG